MTDFCISVNKNDHDKTQKIQPTVENTHSLAHKLSITDQLKQLAF